MADGTSNIEEDDRLRARRERMSGKSRHGSPVWAIFFFLVLLALAATFVVFPEQTRKLLGLNTSTSEDIQQTSKVDNSGISTQIQREPEIAVEPSISEPVIPARAAPVTTTDLDPEAKARIEALEKALREIANRPAPQGGPTADDIARLLDQQAAALRAEAETREQLLKAQLDALRVQTQVPTGPSADQLAEQERLRREAEERERLRKLLEERRAARDAELLKRMTSDGNVYDESEEGRSTSGTKEDETGIRELSDNQQFLKANASQGWETVRAGDLGDVSKTIVQGTIISAVLETAIDTQLPGNIRAQVTRPVYSFDGQTILMPAGTRLIGAYNPKISIAQKRVLIAWNRAITPEGKSVKLAATGIDRLGRGGQAGNVDTRFFQRFGTAVLITSIAAIPSFLASDDANGNTTTSAATGVAQDASDDLKDTTEDVLEEYLKLPPIIRIPQGTLMNVLVNQDLVFS
ncbi:MAG: conjugal transfer protein [Ahrensia sp.]|nr:conjugal transfer protein [Ahrensia sp.]